jgi:hypothetical protein
MHVRIILWGVVLAILVVLAALYLSGEKELLSEISSMPDTEQKATSTASDIPSVAASYGEVTLSLKQMARFEELRLVPLSVSEDSRCPVDVQCIQAGTVRIELRMISGLGTSTMQIELGREVTTEAEVIRFVSVSPDAHSNKPIGEDEYRFTFEVRQKEEESVSVTPTVPQPLEIPTGKCFVGGCSSQLCTDNPDMASTCEYREEYACYQNAECKRQSNGQCGWTQTPQLEACLLSSQ